MHGLGCMECSKRYTYGFFCSACAYATHMNRTLSNLLLSPEHERGGRAHKVRTSRRRRRPLTGACLRRVPVGSHVFVLPSNEAAEEFCIVPAMVRTQLLYVFKETSRRHAAPKLPFTSLDSMMSVDYADPASCEWVVTSWRRKSLPRNTRLTQQLTTNPRTLHPKPFNP